MQTQFDRLLNELDEAVNDYSMAQIKLTTAREQMATFLVEYHPIAVQDYLSRNSSAMERLINEVRK